MALHSRDFAVRSGDTDHPNGHAGSSLVWHKRKQKMGNGHDNCHATAAIAPFIYS